MKNQGIQPIQKNLNPLMSFSPQYLAYSTARSQQMKQTAHVATSVVSETTTKVKKMRWGEPTWFAFHTLAEKVKEESFPLIRHELLNIINTICNNLPCPECAKHATAYMNSINFNSIQTKEHLKIMLFNFHNEVNRKKGFPIFEYENLQAKYSKANLIPILQNFMRHFEDRTGSFKLIADQMTRARLCSHIRTWLQNNLFHFQA
jgi:hypothetical protein